jgi:hypothetical protein
MLMLILHIAVGIIKLLNLRENFAIITGIFIVTDVFLYLYYANFFRRFRGKGVSILVLLPLLISSANIVLFQLTDSRAIVILVLFFTALLFGFETYLFVSFISKKLNLSKAEQQRRVQEEILSTNIFSVVTVGIIMLLNIIYGKNVASYIITAALYALLAWLCISRFIECSPDYRWKPLLALEVVSFAICTVITVIFGSNVFLELAENQKTTINVFPMFIAVLFVIPNLYNSKRIYKFITKKQGNDIVNDVDVS